MSPEDLDSLANDIENYLKKDFVLISGFYPRNSQDHSRAKKLFAFKILCLLNIARLCILNFLCLFPSSKTPTDFRLIFVDTFIAFGSFGRLTNQMALLGWIFTLNFCHVMHKAENNRQLDVISHIKDHRKFRLTPLERIKFAKYLKWIKTMRSLLIYVALPTVLLFISVGGCLSSLEVQSMSFAVASVFVTLINNIQLYFGFVWTNYACMMPVHSNNVLSIQFNRLFESIKNLERAQNFIDRNLKPDSETREQEVSVKLHHWVKQAKQRVKKRDEILKRIENVLRQIDLHNETVKHILGKAISCVVPAYGLAIVFFADERGDLLHQTFSIGLCLTALIFYISLLNTHGVYTLSLRLSSELHSIQARLKGKGMKSQLQILRLIQRTSDCESWDHSVGFTVGDLESLSPMSVLLSFSDTISIALTFWSSMSN